MSVTRRSVFLFTLCGWSTAAIHDGHEQEHAEMIQTDGVACDDGATAKGGSNLRSSSNDPAKEATKPTAPNEVANAADPANEATKQTTPKEGAIAASRGVVDKFGKIKDGGKESIDKAVESLSQSPLRHLVTEHWIIVCIVGPVLLLSLPLLLWASEKAKHHQPCLRSLPIGAVTSASISFVGMYLAMWGAHHDARPEEALAILAPKNEKLVMAFPYLVLIFAVIGCIDVVCLLLSIVAQGNARECIFQPGGCASCCQNLLGKVTFRFAQVLLIVTFAALLWLLRDVDAASFVIDTSLTTCKATSLATAIDEACGSEPTCELQFKQFCEQTSGNADDLRQGASMGSTGAAIVLLGQSMMIWIMASDRQKIRGEMEKEGFSY